MAIDGTDIIDSDLAHDIQNEFLKHYDAGLTISEIRQKLGRWKAEFSDDLEREIFASVMCQVLWEVGELGSEDLRELTSKLEDESGLKIWKTLGEDAYQERKRTLQKQVEELSKPKLQIRKRIAAPTPFFQIGDLVEYQTSGGEIRHLLLIETCQKGETFLYALAPIKLDPAVELNSSSISAAEFFGRKGTGRDYSFGLAVALLDHHIIASFQNRFQIKLNVVIDSKKASIGSFGGVLSIEDFERNIRIFDGKIFGNGSLKLELILKQKAKSESSLYLAWKQFWKRFL